MKVLLIEPDNMLAAVYESFLESRGHEVIRAATSRSAVDAVGSVLPEVILIELQLAGHNGIEFLYEIRSYSDLRHVPAIILSQVHPAKISHNTRQLELLGVKRHLYKPHAKLPEIQEAIEEAVL